MDFEHALVARARPYMLAAKARVLVEHEAAKGCTPDLSPVPVALEPPYAPLPSIMGQGDEPSLQRPLPENPPPYEQLVRLRLWISPEEKFDWKRSELLVKQFQGLHHRFVFQIIGNKDDIAATFVCRQDDVPVVTTAFRSAFPQSELTSVSDDGLNQLPPDAWRDVVFVDYYPVPPYSWLMTRPDELRYSPLEPIFAAMRFLFPPAVGFYQTVFQPVHPDHDWHSNVEYLLDLEFMIKLHGGLHNPQRYAQQAPSGDLRQMAGEVVTKAHPDKPFYASAIRVGVIGAEDGAVDSLRCLTAFSGFFLHGGHSLRCLDERAYVPSLDVKGIREFFLQGLTYRPGWLVNSWELVGLVHAPPPELLESQQIKAMLLGLGPEDPTSLASGTQIGTCAYAGCDLPICIPPFFRGIHTHVIGGSGEGKSTEMENMALQEMGDGNGVGVLDPHGDLIDRLLDRIPPEAVERTIYFDPGDPDWVACWNPFVLTPGYDIGRVADDLVGAVKSVVTGWGDRLEHLLRHAFYSLLHVPDTTLLDVTNLLRKESSASKRLIGDILSRIDEEPVRAFWQEDFPKYRPEERSSAMHKLSKLLVAGRLSLMFCQPQNRIDLRRIMNEGFIFLADLSNIGSEAREILGSLLLSLFHQGALGRARTPKAERRPFSLYCDEAHRFLTPAIEDLLTDSRKYGLRLTMAHQYMSQFTRSKADALGNVGAAIVFRVDADDARYLAKGFGGKVDADDFVALNPYEAIARIGHEVVRIQTLPPREVQESSSREAIIQMSHERYYRPVAEVQRIVHRRCQGSTLPVMPLPNVGGDDEFIYDEF